MAWKENYKPFGECQIKSILAGINSTHFASKPKDEESSLAYFGARYYDPILGRFMGLDPVAPNPENIHSFNRYAYANNNPYKFVDPDGRNPELLFGSCPTCFSTGFDNPETAYSSRAEALGVNLDTGEGKRQLAESMFDEARALITLMPQGEGMLLSAGLILKLKSSAATFGQIKTALVSAQKVYKGSTVVGHALSKHAGRKPEIWGTIDFLRKSFFRQSY